MQVGILSMGVLLSVVLAPWGATRAATAIPPADYEAGRWDPVHFKPAIEAASDEQCLACHGEVLAGKPLTVSPAGVRAAESLAWYQTLETYTGSQETFHWRHMESPLADRLMNLSCNFCHQGHDPRDEAPATHAGNRDGSGFTLRKSVDAEAICLRCHGRHNYEIMGLPGPWTETREMMNSSCVLCHAAIRTHRHQVTYLNPAAIEEEGARNSDVCYGCHGGRQWYRTTYPYPRHPYPGIAEEVPEWAQGRPVESEPRYQLRKAAN